MLARDGVGRSSCAAAPALDRTEPALDELAELVGDLPLALEEAAAYLEQTRRRPGRATGAAADGRGSCSGSTPAAPADGGRGAISGGWPRCGRCRWTGSTTQAPAAEALLSLCAFLGPGHPPRRCPPSTRRCCPSRWPAVADDRLAYNRLLAVVGRYSLATVSPTRSACTGWCRR